VKLVIGKSAGKNAAIDLETLLATRLLIQANSGGGKSWLLRRIAEQLVGKVPVIIIDPEGEFATLREKFPFFLIGQGGDAPAHVRSAALLAETLLKLRACAVCDLYETFRKTPVERHQWVKEFLGGMLDAPKNLWGETVIIVDEAHLFCPEQGESPAEGVMVGIATAGRKRGFCPIWATQRLALVDKSASSQLQNRMVGLTFEDVDVVRAVNLLSVAKEDQHDFKEKVKVLEPGEFFAFGRAISKTRILVKVGPVETSHPKMGKAARSVEPPPPPEKIKALLPKLADLPKTAEEKLKTEAELRTEIRTLRTQLRSQPVKQEAKEVKVADPRATERAVRPLRALLEEAMRVMVKVNAAGFDDAAIKPEEIAKALETTAKEISRLAKAGLEKRASEFERLKRETNLLLAKMKRLLSEENLTVKVDVRHNQPFTVSAPARPAAAASNGELTPYQLDILRGLAELEAIGRSDATVPLVGVAAGKSAKSSTFERYSARLKALNLIRVSGPGRLALTDEGRAHVPPSLASLSSEDLQERCRKLLTPYQADILNVLIAAHPDALSWEQIGQGSGKQPSSSTFERYMAAMRSMEIIEYSGAKTAKCAEWLFVD
jgi:hypothetical protein